MSLTEQEVGGAPWWIISTRLPNYRMQDPLVVVNLNLNLSWFVLVQVLLVNILQKMCER